MPGQFSKEEQDRIIREANDTLAKLAGGSLKVNDLFRDRTDGKSFIEKPPTMSIEEVVMHGSKIIAAEAEEVIFSRNFKARPYDGAVAFQQVLTQTYGFGAIGKTIRSFFGSQLPEFKNVTTGLRVDENGEKVFDTTEVPWGLMSFSPLEAEFMLHEEEDEDYGLAFSVGVKAPKRQQPAIIGLFMLVEEYLKRNSIYRGKALYGVGRTSSRGRMIEPEFTNPYSTDRTKIVYADKTWTRLGVNVLARIMYTDACRREGISIGAKILTFGENGTGKTEFTKIASQFAIEHGWGAIQARFDEDIAKVIAFAERTGTPTLVCVEDVEKLIPADGNPKRMDQLLDLFDGAQTKGREVLLLMTSNHVDELRKSIQRAGRIDRQIPVGSLDNGGLRKLINVIVPPERIRGDLDYDRLIPPDPDDAASHNDFAAFEGYSPAWVMEALKGLKLAAVWRTGESGSQFTTEDFIVAAEELRDAWNRHMGATDRPAVDTMTDVMRRLVDTSVKSALEQHYVYSENEGSMPILLRS